jgi:drug/metabolite transporter (DMT)-like permease
MKQTDVSLGTPRRQQIAGIVFVNVATFTWSTNIVLGRWLRDDVGPLTLAASRFLIASVLFWLLLQRQPPDARRLSADRWHILGMALSGVVIFSPLLYLGLRYTSAVNATLINGLSPLITGVLAAALIHEPMSKRQVTGAATGLVGVFLLISGGSFSVAQLLGGNIGDIIVLGAACLWGLYSVLGRVVMRQRSVLSATAFSAFLGVPLLLLAAIWELQSMHIHLRAELIGAVLYIGIAPTVIGFSSWNAGVRRLNPSGAMVFYNTLSLYGVLMGRLFLNESISSLHLLGGTLIIGGGLWAALARS